MKVISVWQPWSTLLIRGYKIFETRTWAPPASAIGKETGIAATKNVIPAQRDAFNDPIFQDFYRTLDDMPRNFEELPRGFLLGTAVLDSYEPITEEFLEEITAEERAYGWYKLGGFAWRFRDRKPLEHPIPIRGAQGLFEWKGFENAGRNQEIPENVAVPQGPAGENQGARGSLRLHV